MQKSAELVKAIFEQTWKSNTFGQCLKKVKLISLGSGKCTAELEVSEEHLNLGGILHGGFTSTLVDCISTYALMTYKDRVIPGISVDLHVTFMKAAYPGDSIVIDANTVKAGNKLAFLEVEIRKKLDGVIIAQGHQTKYVGVKNSW